MNEIKIEIVSSSGKPYYAHDMEFNVFTFPTAEHAAKYLKQVVGLSDEEIKALAAENFFHADFDATLKDVYGEAVNPDSLVVEGGVIE